MFLLKSSVHRRPLKIACKLLFSNFCEMFHCIFQCLLMSVANLFGAWFWTFFEACIYFSVLKHSCKELWIWFWWFWMFFEACIRLSILKCFVAGWCSLSTSVYTLNLTLVIPNYPKVRCFSHLLSSSTAEHKNNQWTASSWNYSHFSDQLYFGSCDISQHLFAWKRVLKSCIVSLKLNLRRLMLHILQVFTLRREVTWETNYVLLDPVLWRCARAMNTLQLWRHHRVVNFVHVNPNNDVTHVKTCDVKIALLTADNPLT